MQLKHVTIAQDMQLFRNATAQIDESSESVTEVSAGSFEHFVEL